MQPSLAKRAGLSGIALCLALAGLAACDHRITNLSSRTPKASPPDASAVVIGTAPAEPTGDPPGTTPVSSGTKEITKAEETQSKPQEGDNHAHSSVAESNPQKAGGTDPEQTKERSAQ